MCAKNRKITPLPVVELHSNIDLWNPREILHKKQSCFRCRFLFSCIFGIDIRLAAEFAQDLRLAAEFAPAPNLVFLCKMTISFQNQRKICDFFIEDSCELGDLNISKKNFFHTSCLTHSLMCLPMGEDA